MRGIQHHSSDNMPRKLDTTIDNLAPLIFNHEASYNLEVSIVESTQCCVNVDIYTENVRILDLAFLQFFSQPIRTFSPCPSRSSSKHGRLAVPVSAEHEFRAMIGAVLRSTLF